MKETLVSQLKAMKQEYDPLVPRVDFKRTTRDRVFSYCNATCPTDTERSTVQEKVQAFVSMLVPTQMVQAARTVTSLALIVAIGVGGWIASVSASYQSVPGDALYNVKLATEKVQIVVSEVTQEKTKTAKLHTEFAARRAEEVQRVIEKKKEPEQAKAAMQLLVKSVDQATAAIQEAEDEGYDGTDVFESTKQLLSDTEQIILVLQGALDTLSPGVIELVDEIIAMQGDLTDRRLTALEDIIINKIDGRIDLSDEEVIAIVKTSVTSLRNRASANETITKELQEQEESTAQNNTAIVMPDAVETSSTPKAATGIATTSSTNSTTTVQLDTNSSTASVEVDTSEAKINIDDVEAKSVVVQETLSEVDTLIDQGNLIGALEKAKQANIKTSEVEQVVKKASVQAKDDKQSQEETTVDDVPSEPAAPTAEELPTTTPGDTTTTLSASTTNTPISEE